MAQDKNSTFTETGVGAATVNGVAQHYGIGAELHIEVATSSFDRTTGDETMIVTFEVSANGSTGWTEVLALPTYATAGVTSHKSVVVTELEYFRYVLTFAGTTPVATLTVEIN